MGLGIPRLGTGVKEAICRMYTAQTQSHVPKKEPPTVGCSLIQKPTLRGIGHPPCSPHFPASALRTNALRKNGLGPSGRSHRAVGGSGSRAPNILRASSSVHCVVLPEQSLGSHMSGRSCGDVDGQADTPSFLHRWDLSGKPIPQEGLRSHHWRG